MYVYGFNMPGYLPDNEPYGFDTFEEAKACLIDDLKHYENDAAGEDEATNFCHAAEDVNLWSGPGMITVGDYVFWIDQE